MRAFFMMGSGMTKEIWPDEWLPKEGEEVLEIDPPVCTKCGLEIAISRRKIEDWAESFEAGGDPERRWIYNCWCGAWIEFWKDPFSRERVN